MFKHRFRWSLVLAIFGSNGSFLLLYPVPFSDIFSRQLEISEFSFNQASYSNSTKKSDNHTSETTSKSSYMHFQASSFVDWVSCSMSIPFLIAQASNRYFIPTFLIKFFVTPSNMLEMRNACPGETSSSSSFISSAAGREEPHQSRPANHPTKSPTTTTTTNRNTMSFKLNRKLLVFTLLVLVLTKVSATPSCVPCPQLWH